MTNLDIMRMNGLLAALLLFLSVSVFGQSYKVFGTLNMTYKDARIVTIKNEGGNTIITIELDVAPESEIILPGSDPEIGSWLAMKSVGLSTIEPGRNYMPKSIQSVKLNGKTIKKKVSEPLSISTPSLEESLLAESTISFELWFNEMVDDIEIMQLFIATLEGTPVDDPLGFTDIRMADFLGNGPSSMDEPPAIDMEAPVFAPDDDYSPPEPSLHIPD